MINDWTDENESRQEDIDRGYLIWARRVKLLRLRDDLYAVGVCDPYGGVITSADGVAADALRSAAILAGGYAGIHENEAACDPA